MLATTSIARVIRERTSVKKGYMDKEVTQELVLSLLKDAVWAPTHKIREPWRFIFVSGERREAFIEAILPCYEKNKQEATRDKFIHVPAFLVVIINDDPRQKQAEEDFAAASCMLQNLQLLAWEQDLGMVWKTPQHIRDPKFREALNVQPGEKIIGVLNIGYFDKAIVTRKVRQRTDPEQKMTVF
ncbi:nitroreductase [Lederbergia sp. NSJ-179]|uniref:nitroreductase family protein n=1 Tax=Lederbergia sp. NSJ-179 TaxID=2931402 RepID=UPI001FCFDDC7|nr:nitroreductase [Lederbergia sp. NSJ-179]MCJ7841020.1 nitroreductase [Lederbergia sp. NSJ-179]